MSGPATTADTAGIEPAGPRPTCVEIGDSRADTVAGVPVRRALPRPGRRTVGAWCFADHVGPTDPRSAPLNVGPHPHIGLQTVTWLLDGEVLHRDSLGTEQLIRPGQLNLMTAGRGVAHSEETAGEPTRPVHGVQLWVAQPETTRHGPPAFEHHADLPRLEWSGCTATILIGSIGGAVSPARRDSDHVGVDLRLRGATTIPTEPAYEYALVVTAGSISIGSSTITPGRLAYLGLGRDELPLTTAQTATALLIGGVPFPERVRMWWNYVARTNDEITRAHRDWTRRTGRFGAVASPLAAIDVGPPPWATS